MKLSQEDLITATELANTNPCVKSLLEHYNFVISNSAYDSYITRKNYLDNWNKELAEKEVQLINTKDDGGTHDAAVNRAMKYFEGQLEFLKDTEAIKSMLMPEEVEQLRQDRRLIKNIAI